MLGCATTDWFENAPVAMLAADFSAFRPRLEELHSRAPAGLRSSLGEQPAELEHLATLVQVLAANREARSLFATETPEDTWRALWRQSGDPPALWAGAVAALDLGATRFEGALPWRSGDGTRNPLRFSLRVAPGSEHTLRSVVVSLSVNALAAQDGPDPWLEQDLCRSIVRDNPEPLLALAPDGRVRFANAAAEALLGFTEQELRGAPLHDLIHHHHADLRPFPAAECSLSFRLPRGAPKQQQETTFFRKDGTPFLCSCTAAPLVVQGAHRGSVLTLRDITAQRRTEHALAEEKERFSSAFEDAAIGMALVSPAGKFLKVNRAVCELLGYSECELLGKTFQDVTWHGDLDADLAFVRQLLSGELRTYQMEKRYLHKQGHQVWVQLSVSLVRNQQGEPLHFISQIQDISERKRAEAALRESESNLRKVQEAARMGQWVMDLRTNHLSWSDGIFTLFEVERQGFAASYEAFLARVHPEDRAQVDHAYRASIETKTPYETEHRLLMQDGRVKWVTEYGSTEYDDAGNPVRTVGTVQDVTERKQMEDVQAFLARTTSGASSTPFFEALATYLTESLRMPFVCIDRLEGDGLHARTVALRHDGQFQDNITYALQDTPCRELVGREVRCFPSGVAGQFPRDLLLQQLRAESYVGVTLWSHTGRPIGLIAVIGREPLPNRRQAETTLRLVAVRAAGEMERLEVEQALRERIERHELVIAGSGAALWDWDIPNKRVLFSPQWKALRGYAENELSDHEDEWSSRIHPDDAPRVAAAVQAHLEGRTAAFAEEYRVRSKDGSWKWISDRGQALRAADGRAVRMAGYEEDITARKRAEAALREADERKNEFLGVLSHELRNPLAPIRNSLYILERSAPGSAQAHRAQAVIGRQVMHLARLIDDLLDVTRIARGKTQLQRERLDLGGAVRRTLDDFRSDFETRGVRLEERIAPQPLWFNGDVTRIAQAVGNLLGNAAKFTPQGGTVVVSLEREGAQAVLRVRDSGAGIAPEVLPHLFEPFVQAPQTLARTRGGLGLGLALVKGLVELHGGTVGVTSPGLGQGTEFTVRLPVEAVTVAADVAPAPPRPPARPRRVLVIEDNVDAADSLKEVLEFGGHDVRVAFDGPSGLSMAQAFRPEVVLCDIGLPGMDGFQVAQRLRSNQALQGTVLVALTGYALPQDKQRAQEAGFNHHLAKPPSLESLDQVLATSH